MNTVAAIAAIVSAVAATATLALYIRANRPQLEVRLSAEPADGSVAGQRVKVFELTVSNVGSSPARLSVAPLLDGVPLAPDSNPVLLPPPLHRSYSLNLSIDQYDRVVSGASFGARVRFGWRREVFVAPGERKST